MSYLPDSILDGREAIGPWNYAARIPEGASSRDYSFIPLLVSAIVGSIGMFLGSDVARNVPFWSNASVWFALILSIMAILLSAWMYFGSWVWTAPQMALFGFAGFAPIFWAFQGATLASFLLYSKAPLLARTGILLVFLMCHGWWGWKTAKKCLSIWTDTTLRDKVWISYDCATVYRRSAAKSAMNVVGVVLHPGAVGLLSPILSCVPLYIYRHEIIDYLGVPWIPMIGFVLGFSPFILMTTASTAGTVMMFIIPARIVANTGKPVLVDMMTPANAPR